MRFKLAKSLYCIFYSLVILLTPFYALSQTQTTMNFQFRHLMTGEDNSSGVGAVTRILQDEMGFIWASGEGGLARYDGHNFKYYYADENKKGSLKSNFISDMLIDKKGTIWIGSSRGLHRYNALTDNFTLLPSNNQKANKVSVIALAVDSQQNIYVATRDGVFLFNEKDNVYKAIGKADLGLTRYSQASVLDIYVDRLDRVWIGTAQKGLGLYNALEDSFRFWQYDESDENSLSSNYVGNVLQDQQGYLWLATKSKGINRLSPNLKNIKRYYHDPNNINSIGNNAVAESYEMPSGQLAFATDHGGISFYNAEQDSFSTIKKDIQIPSSLGSNQVMSLFTDKDGDLWAGLFPSGLDYWDSSRLSFDSYINDLNNQTSLSNNGILSIMEDSQKNIWVGTEEGLNLKEKNSSKFIQYFADAKNEQQLMSNTITIMKEDIDGEIWIGTWAGGLHKLDKKRKQFKRYYPRYNAEHGFLSDSVWGAVIDSRDTVWFGTEEHGIARYDRENDSFEHFMHESNNPFSLSNNRIWDLIEEKPGVLLIATLGGLNRYEIDKKKFSQVGVNSSHLSSLLITDLLKLDNGEIWIGTQDRGIAIMNEKGDIISSLDLSSGLPSNRIASMVQDRNGLVWVTSSRGVARVEPNSQHIKSLFKSDGLTSNLFNRNATGLDYKGNVYLGSSNGLTVIKPQIISDERPDIPLYISSLKLFNKEVAVSDDNSPLNHSMLFTDTLELEHNQSMISFGFTALNYRTPLKTKYAYKLEGFDQSWNEIGANYAATYTNLDGGDYVFKVKVSTKLGEWEDNPDKLYLTIKPSPWHSLYAKAVYLLIFACLIYLVVYLKLLNKARSSALNSASAKSNFLATMSHEIRTPISGVIGMLGFALKDKKLSNETKDHLEIAMVNAESLLDIINDILDLSKIEAGKLTIEVIGFDLRKYIKGSTAVFYDLAQNKGIAFNVTIASNVPQFIKGDPTRIRQILVNFISNAIKFTDSGFVNVKIHCEEVNSEKGKNSVSKEGLHFVVSDTGVGIPADVIGKLFNKFEQADASTTRKFGGTGLGLAICQHLIEAMNGNVSVESQEGAGSHFKFSIPLLEALQDDFHSEIECADDQAHSHQLDILCAEDFVTNQVIIQTLLEGMGHKVTIAENGVEALHAVAETNYDLIFMDGRMPEMDGVETTQHIRQGHWKNLSFSDPNIIIVALTANVTEEDRARYFDAGMNDFLGKPVIKDKLEAVLKRAISNLLAQGRELKPLEEGPPSIDELDDLFGIADGEKGEPAYKHIEDSGPVKNGTEQVYVKPKLTEFELKLVDTFVGSLQERLDEIDHGLEVANFDVLARVFHGIKGSAGYLRDEPLVEIAKAQEIRADEHSIDDIKQAMPDFLAALKPYIDAIGKILLVWIHSSYLLFNCSVLSLQCFNLYQLLALCALNDLFLK